MENEAILGKKQRVKKVGGAPKKKGGPEFIFFKDFGTPCMDISFFQIIIAHIPNDCLFLPA